jgi:glutaconate CoA-transferase subunit B
MLRQSDRTFVPSVDFVTSVGFGRGGEGRPDRAGKGPTVVITDLGVLRPDPSSNELTLVATHPGVTIEQVRENTGWDLMVADDIADTVPPTPDELEILRDLKTRTSKAHSR